MTYARCAAGRRGTGTALDATLRVSDVSPRNDKVPPNAELARFVTMESDPSQDEAVLPRTAGPRIARRRTAGYRQVANDREHHQ